MFKFKAAIQKELRLMIRDRVGLTIMFVMPVILVMVMTAIQNSTYELVNDNKISMVVVNNDSNTQSKEFLKSLKETGLFLLVEKENINPSGLLPELKKEDALVALVIPKGYFSQLEQKAQVSAQIAMQNFGMGKSDSLIRQSYMDSITMLFNPVLQESYKSSIKGALQSVLQILENKLMIRSLYFEVNQKEIPGEIESELLPRAIEFTEQTFNTDGKGLVPNASQHNVPAWTLFAMFFTVISLGGNLVKEKLSGSFIRLKLLPTNYVLNLLAKQLVYLGVALLQVLLIFSIGVWIFPMINLPPLNIPTDWIGLFLVSLICGACGISFALCIGIFAKTHEQANGFGSVAVVILAAIGGVFVPSFAMPHSFNLLLHVSPFYWGLQAFYGLFLENNNFGELLLTILPLIGLIFIFQFIAFIGLKKRNLI